MSSKIFVHQPRKVRRAARPASAPGVVAEDPIARRLQIEAERRERERIDAERRARQAHRSEERRAREVELDEIEKMASEIFPWDRLESQRAIVSTTMRFFDRRPLTPIAWWWGCFNVFEPAQAAGLPPLMLDLLWRTCPLTLDMARIEPLVAFLGRRERFHDPDFDPESCRATVLAAASQQIERKRQTLLADVRAFDIRDGWFVLNREFDGEAGAILARRLPLARGRARPPRQEIEDPTNPLFLSGAVSP
jgi:hypothetical protein